MGRDKMVASVIGELVLDERWVFLERKFTGILS